MSICLEDVCNAFSWVSVGRNDIEVIACDSLTLTHLSTLFTSMLMLKCTQMYRKSHICLAVSLISGKFLSQTFETCLTCN